jgi:hypothetical protein
MKLYILIFSLFFLLNTEGVAQDVLDTITTTPIEMPLESTDANEEDDAEYEATLAKAEKAYQDNLQKYYDENLPQKDFDKDAWQKATNGLDYTIEAEKEKEEEKKRTDKSQSSPQNISPAFIAFLKWFFIIGAVVLLGYLIYRFVDGGNVFGNGSRRVHLPSVGIDLEELEENLEESDDIEPLIRKAIEKKEYAIAVRLYYLAILKELSLKNVIEWKKDKTNRTYVREMRLHTLHEPFKNMTSTFERVWYGDTRLDEATFMGIQPAFRDLLNQSKKA